MKKAFVLSILILGLACTIAARAEQLDLETTNEVVERIDSMAGEIDPSSESYLPMQLRLADLLAERARLTEVADPKAESATLKKAAADRTRAVEIYQKNLSAVKGPDLSRVLGQIAHLEQLLGQHDKAKALLTEIAGHPNKYSNDLLIQAEGGLGEMALSKGEYKEAMKRFQNALRLKPSNPYYFKSRLAWTYFHSEMIAQATQTLGEALKEAPATETSFKDEASRDYASFLAHGTLSQTTFQKDLVFLSKNTSETSRHENLEYLASELDRLGKKNDALYVWKFIGVDPKSTGSDLESHLKFAQAEYDLGHKAEAAQEIKIFADLWKKKSCDPTKENCEIIRSRLKKILTDWAKAEQRNPSTILTQACMFYVDAFTDLDMVYWLAQILEYKADYANAKTYYRRAADVSKAQIAKESSHHDSKIETTFEGACLGEIEVAEKTKSLEQKREAYEHYITANPRGAHILSVRYQRAYCEYEAKNYPEAATRMHDVALDTQNRSATEASFRQKAADTSIEALVAIKDEPKIAAYSNEYSGIFKDKQDEYKEISRNAILSQESRKINEAKSDSDVKSGLDTLAKIDLKGLSKSDKLKILKSRLAAAEKIKDLGAIYSICEQILDVKGITAEDKEMALSREEWVSEMRLNFSLAYSIALKMKMKSLSQADRDLKLGFLAELSGRDPKKYYLSFLKESHVRAQREQIIAKIVRSARNEKSEFTKYQNELKHNISLYSQLALEIFAKHEDYKFAKQILRTPGVSNTAYGATLARFDFINEYKQIKSLRSHPRLEAQTAGRLKSSLNLRLALIKQMKKQFTKAEQAHDWVLEAVTLEPIQTAYSQLGKDIQNLPIPKSIKGQDREKYKRLLAGQADPYFKDSEHVGQEIDALLKKADLDNLYKETRESVQPIRGLLISEIGIIESISRDTDKKSIGREIAKIRREAAPSANSESFIEARREVGNRPFDTSKLLNLKEVAAKSNQPTFVAYLDQRITENQKAGAK